MTYLDYVIFFQKLDGVSQFSPGATRLYLKLLYVANLVADGGPWPTQFTKSNPEMVGLCGGAANSFREYREELQGRGLIVATSGGKGPKAVTSYQLLSSKKGAKSAPLEGAKSDPLNAKGSKSAPSKGAGISSNFEPSTIIIEEEEEREGKKAADAATPSPSPSAEKSEPAPSPKRQPGKPKKNGASAEEIAALELPHPGPEFATTWGEFLNAPKQQGKSLHAYRLLLKKLARYAEGYAVLMLEKSIENNWQGVEYDSTAADYAKWQQEQARLAATIPAPDVAPAPELNQEFLAQQQAEAAARRKARFEKLETATA